MTPNLNWVPYEVDIDTPSAARIYDYLLSGSHNFAVDRALADMFDQALPGSRDIARLNRTFLRRAVLFLVESGIRQFLDIGSGIPTAGNVHQTARRAAADSRVVHVDTDPIAVAHSQLMLADDPQALAIKADLCEPESILYAPQVRGLLDFSQPIGLLMVWVLHFVPIAQDAVGILRRYRDALAPDSYLAVSHFTADSRPAEMAAMVKVMKRSANPIHLRTRAQIVELFAGFDMVEPGVVATALWRPEGPVGNDADRTEVLAGVGRKP